ncbi:MAG TPA: hypothetical protein VEV16_11485 [Daejeonella sp.]|nr:hypothetical protein [Daejeonella sp.]
MNKDLQSALICNICGQDIPFSRPNHEVAKENGVISALARNNPSAAFFCRVLFVACGFLHDWLINYYIFNHFVKKCGLFCV